MSHPVERPTATVAVFPLPWKYNNFYAVHRTMQVRPYLVDVACSIPWCHFILVVVVVGRPRVLVEVRSGSGRPPDLDWYVGRRQACSMRLICIHAPTAGRQVSRRKVVGARARDGRSSLIGDTFSVVWSMMRLLRLFWVRRRRLSVFQHICAAVVSAVYHVSVVLERHDSLWLPTQLYLHGNSKN